MAAASPELEATHDARVGRIANRVRQIAERGETARVQKGGVHHVVPLPGDRRFDGAAVDVSTLSVMLEIDEAARRCVAEPGITFADAVRATLSVGLLPTLVPELQGITLGGAIAGCSVESMSHRMGGFHDGCLEYEVVTGAGEVITCSRTKDPFLFDMIHGSCGTLAILSRLEFSLVPAAPFVQLEYRHFDRFLPFEAALREACERGPRAPSGHDFVDAIIHAPDHLVLCLGRFAAEAPYVSRWRDEGPFYESTRTRAEDFLTTFDYCFRYDADCHWLTRSVPPLTWRPVRTALGRHLLGSTNLIRWSNRLAPFFALKRRPDVVVDVFIPAHRFAEFWLWYMGRMSHYPLWVVPYRMPRPYPWIADTHQERMAGDLFIDCAIYGKPNGARDVDYSQLLEDKTFELGGIKTLISRNHYSRERFWQIYNLPSYQEAKRRLDPHGVFGDLFDHMAGTA